VKCYGFPDQVKAYFQNAGFLADLQLAFEKMFGRVYYLGPLREYPKRQYTWAGSEPADMGQRGERVVDALLAAAERKSTISMGRGRKKRSLEEHVAWWLRELGLVHSFIVEPVASDSSIYRVKVKKSAQSAEVLITDVGFGVSQILPALVLCYYVPEGSTILLEQPEIHLHPSVQAGLADVFIDAIKRRNVQIIFESHSEHLLRRMQRRIAEGGIGPQDAALYFCEMGQSHSTLTPLQLDKFGNISNWPKEFFGDEFGELAAITRAAMNRKEAETGR
jgi:predicted ATPase